MLISDWEVCVRVAVVGTAAYAQASIAVSVRDNSGAVMPGVTVEASSPALIEKTRSVVTSEPVNTRLST